MLDDWDPGQTEIQVDYYYPFGEINTQSGGGEDTHYKFTGYEEDTGIGLHYAKARFYSPGLGRFLTPDPAGQYFSPYVYVGNRPLVYVDPDGEFGFLALGILAGAFLGGSIANDWQFNPAKWDYSSPWTYVGIIGGGALGYGVASHLGYSFPKTGLDIALQGIPIKTIGGVAGTGGLGYLAYQELGDIDLGSGGGLSSSEIGRSGVDLTFTIYSGHDRFFDRASGRLQHISSLSHPAFLNYGSSYAGYRQNQLVRGGKWRGLNNKWYSRSWGGNQYAGARSSVLQAARSLKIAGRAIGITGIGINSFEAINSLRNDQYADAAIYGLDVFFGAVSFAGPVGLGVGTSYYFLRFYWSNQRIKNRFGY